MQSEIVTSYNDMQSHMPALPTHRSKVFTYIPGFDGYCISDVGDVLSCWVQHKRIVKDGAVLCYRSGWRPLTPKVYKRTGHLSVALSGKWKTVAHLVLLSFVGPCPAGMEARHYPDQSPQNNSVTNLQWATRLVNQRDRVENGTHNRCSNNSQAKLSETQVLDIRHRYSKGNETHRGLAKEYGVTKTCIQYILNRKSWVHI